MYSIEMGLLAESTVPLYKWCHLFSLIWFKLTQVHSDLKIGNTPVHTV